MRTLRIGLRVTDPEQSLACYLAESKSDTLNGLAGHAIEPVGQGMDSDDGLKTRLIADPDGRGIELVQRPAGHADGLTAADWSEAGE